MVRGWWIRLLSACCLALMLSCLVTGCYDGDEPPRTEAQRRKDKRNACEAALACMGIVSRMVQEEREACVREKQTNPKKTCPGSDAVLMAPVALCGGDCYLIF